jgi:hypothetical protein
VTSRVTPQFWHLYRELPRELKIAAKKAFELFLSNPAHPSLRLERMKSDRRAWSVRITRNYRAVAFRRDADWIWVWIGHHQDFDRRFPK